MILVVGLAFKDSSQMTASISIQTVATKSSGGSAVITATRTAEAPLEVVISVVQSMSVMAAVRCA